MIVLKFLDYSNHRLTSGMNFYLNGNVDGRIPSRTDTSTNSFHPFVSGWPGHSWRWITVLPNFSQAAARPGVGTPQIGMVMRNLMHRLGYKKFYLPGGDWGSLIGRNMVTLFPKMSSLVNVPKLKMSDGREMPAIGLGTYLGFDNNGGVKSVNKQLRDVVLEAIDIGYRHFDTAFIYNTEAEIGEAVKMKIDQGAVSREDMFITTKLWNTHHKKEEVAIALRESLNKTGLDYVDLYLMHWPISLNADYSHSDVDFMETWRGLEEMHSLGLAKSIGVSNFKKEQLQRVLDEGTVKPVALQIEVHPQIIQEELINFARSKDIIVMGYSPFGSLVRRFGMDFPGPKMDDPVLVEIAQKYGKTSAQVVLRWMVDRNVVPIPKTVNPKRLLENINIFDFKLEQAEIEKINAFNSNTRFTLPSFWQSHPHYPFEKIKEPIADPFRG